MNKFKNPLITALVLTGLALIGSLMNSHPAVLQAAGGPTVTIDPSQLPLPVTGSTTVAGTVAATQSGVWNVGITGQPVNVNVNNSPTVRLATGTTVLSKNLDEPGRNAYQETKEYSPAAEQTDNYCTSGCLIFSTVPAGKRLVLTNLTGVVSGQLLFLYLDTGPTLPLATEYPITATGGVVASGPMYGINASTRSYFEAGQAPHVSFSRTGPLGDRSRITLAGYYVDVP